MASAAYSRHRQEHPAVAVAVKKQQAQGQGTLPDNGGETTDRPKSDGVTAEHSCPARRERMSAVSFTKGERECPWPAGSVVGLALHRGSTSLPCLPESPKGGESGVAVAVMRSS